VEHSDTHQAIMNIDGYRCTPPILRFCGDHLLQPQQQRPKPAARATDSSAQTSTLIPSTPYTVNILPTVSALAR
jgi:hypothetical protein